MQVTMQGADGRANGKRHGKFNGKAYGKEAAPVAASSQWMQCSCRPVEARSVSVTLSYRAPPAAGRLQIAKGRLAGRIRDGITTLSPPDRLSARPRCVADTASAGRRFPAPACRRPAPRLTPGRSARAETERGIRPARSPLSLPGLRSAAN